MSTININRKSSDPFDRYQMPKLVARVTRTGNASKTILVNIPAVAKALHRSPLHITKYFGFELSTSVQVNSKLNLYVIKGAQNQGKLQDLLDGFINQFVLCRYCGNPETELNCRKRSDNEIYQQCYACGNTNTIRMECHKLAKFILKNWPQDKENTNNYDLNEASIPTEEQSISLNNATVDDDDHEDWDDDLPSSVEDCEQFISLFQKKKLANQLNDAISVQKLVNEAKRLKIMAKAPYYVAKDLFTDQIVKEIDAYQMLLHQLCIKNDEGQQSLLDGLATIVDSNQEIHEKLFNEKQISRILYKLYEKDIVAEGVFYHWYEQESKQLVPGTIATDIREYSKGFIEWLRTAEEADDEEDDTVSNN